MASRKTWIWIAVGAVGVPVVLLIGAAGAGVYFVTQHVHSQRTSSSLALSTLEDAAGQFKNKPPLYEMESGQPPRLARPLNELRNAEVRASELSVLVWEPDNERLVRVSLPFWLLRFGRQKIRVTHNEAGKDLSRLDLDFDELERVGPALVLDYRNHDGVRVLLWTH